MKKRQIEKKISRNIHREQSGCSCSFITLSKTKGIKLYRTLADRNFAMKMQRRAHKVGIGPRVYKAHTICKRVASEFDIGPYGYITQRAAKVERLSRKDIVLLWKRMERHGFATGDVSEWHNAGKIGKRPVCIDFDSVTMSCQ